MEFRERDAHDIIHHLVASWSIMALKDPGAAEMEETARNSTPECAPHHCQLDNASYETADCDMYRVP